MNPQDLRIDSWPPSASGMHVGMPRGVKIQHKPTGLVVTCDSERSQHKNRDKAMAELIEKLSQLQPNARVKPCHCTAANENEHTEKNCGREVASA